MDCKTRREKINNWHVVQSLNIKSHIFTLKCYLSGCSALKLRIFSTPFGYDINILRLVVPHSFTQSSIWQLKTAEIHVYICISVRIVSTTFTNDVDILHRLHDFGNATNSLELSLIYLHSYVKHHALRQTLILLIPILQKRKGKRTDNVNELKG